MKTSHRISIDIGDNEFLQEQPDHNIVDTRTGLTATTLSPKYTDEILRHQMFGHSDLCVICAGSDTARKPRTYLLSYLLAGKRGYCVEVTRNGKTRMYNRQTNRRVAVIRKLTESIPYSGGLRIEKSV